MFQLTKMK